MNIEIKLTIKTKPTQSKKTPAKPKQKPKQSGETHNTVTIVNQIQ